MATTQPSHQERTGRTDPRPHYLHVGTDTEGAHHLYDTRRERVLVVADDRRQHTQDLTERSIDEWMAYVEDRRGWAERYLYPDDGGLAGVIAHLEAALEA